MSWFFIITIHHTIGITVEHTITGTISSRYSPDERYQKILEYACTSHGIPVEGTTVSYYYKEKMVTPEALLIP